MLVKLLNLNRAPVAVLDRRGPLKWNRRVNQATEIEIGIPRGDIKLEQVALAAYLEVWDGTALRASGRIVARDVGPDAVRLTALTEEILLSSILTPDNYGPVFANLDLAEVARQCLDGWYPQRVASKTQWDAALEKSNVDTATLPGKVVLAKDAGKHYLPSGYITVRFQSSSVPGFKRWDRIRWASDYDKPVQSTMQYRLDGGAWSAEIRGALTDSVGVAIPNPSASTVDVRINLYTDDTTTPDDETNPTVYGVTPILFGVEAIARTNSGLQAGSIPASAGVTVRGLEADRSTALEVLRRACEQAGWEFEVRQGALYLAQSLGTDRTPEVLLVGGGRLMPLPVAESGISDSSDTVIVSESNEELVQNILVEEE